MNNLTPHSRVATSYFRGGLVTVLFFTIAIFFQTPGELVISRWANLAGRAAILSYASFIGLADRHKSDDSTIQPESEPVIKDRPRFWLIPALGVAGFHHHDPLVPADCPERMTRPEYLHSIKIDIVILEGIRW